MNFKTRNKPVVDILFLLALFSVFLISALFVILFGAKIYRKTVSGMDDNFKSRTALSYVTEKMRQHDHIDGACVIEAPDGSMVLRLQDSIEDNIYYTYLYEKDGYLMELTAKSDFKFNKSGGQQIVETDGFIIEQVSNSLYRVKITDGDGNELTYFVSQYSAVEGPGDGSPVPEDKEVALNE